MAQRVKGTARIRALLRGLPGASRAELADVLEDGGKAMVPAMRARAPRRTGATQAGISYKVERRTLRLKVGILGGLRKNTSSRGSRFDLFYARVQDLGRKAQTVRVTRRGSAAYQLRVKAMSGKHFVTGALPSLRADLNTRLRDAFTRALSRISRGEE